jgi:flagellar export protein FliJ
MTRFDFRLEAALRLRHMRVESETTRLQDLFAQRKRLEQSLASIGEERMEASAFIQAAQTPSTGDLRALSLFTLGLEARSKTVREGLIRAEKSIAEQKQRLMKAEQDERALFKLREKRFAEWQSQAQREIEATAQELWLFSHTTNKDDRV